MITIISDTTEVRYILFIFNLVCWKDKSHTIFNLLCGLRLNHSITAAIHGIATASLGSRLAWQSALQTSPNRGIAEETVFLISIYDKSEKENLTDKELDELLKYVPE